VCRALWKAARLNPLPRTTSATERVQSWSLRVLKTAVIRVFVTPFLSTNIIIIIIIINIVIFVSFFQAGGVLTVIYLQE
jgi:hypothetical protein